MSIRKKMASGVAAAMVLFAGAAAMGNSVKAPAIDVGAAGGDSVATQTSALKKEAAPPRVIGFSTPSFKGYGSPGLTGEARSLSPSDFAGFEQGVGGSGAPILSQDTKTGNLLVETNGGDAVWLSLDSVRTNLPPKPIQGVEAAGSSARTMVPLTPGF